MASPTFETFRNHITQYYYNLLNIKIGEEKLQILEKREWDRLCSRFNLNHDSEGIFLPRNSTTYLLMDSNNLLLNFFHEYFGHSLFCKYSKQGRFLTNLEKKLMKEEKQEFRGEDFSQEEILKFRKDNPIYKLLKKEKEMSLGLYETFAIWTEHYLSGLFGMRDNFEQKYSKMPKGIRGNLERMIKFQQDHGEIALFYNVGMPKYYDTKQIRTLLEQISKYKINDAELILLYGSRKPYSDIDLFVVSPKIKDFTNRWLDGLY